MPYIAERSQLFAEGAERGYLLKRPDGDVWQRDRWQAGMGYVDFTNPAATRWFQAQLRSLLQQGVDCFKTDFGERIPVDVEWADGSDPLRMHNLYTQLYNEAVHEVLVETRGEGEAVLFARSATAGGQTMLAGNIGRLASNTALGSASSKTTVYGSVARTRLISVKACAYGITSEWTCGWLVPCISRSKVNTTAAASSGVPS